MDAILKHIFDAGTNRLTDLVDNVLARHKKPKLKPWPLGLRRSDPKPEVVHACGSPVDNSPSD